MIARRVGEPVGQSSSPENQPSSREPSKPRPVAARRFRPFAHSATRVALAGPKLAVVSTTLASDCSPLRRTMTAGYAETSASNASTSCIVMTVSTA